MTVKPDYLVAIAWIAMLLITGPARADAPAPDFALPDASDRLVSNDEFAGQVVLINFWASWCGPCREEMPLLDALYERYAPLGLAMVGINVEADSGDADRFLAGTPVDFPILYDRENEVSERFDVIAMPTTVIIDRAGRMRFVHHGYEPGYENEYQDQIRALIRE